MSGWRSITFPRPVFFFPFLLLNFPSLLFDLVGKSIEKDVVIVELGDFVVVVVGILVVVVVVLLVVGVFVVVVIVPFLGTTLSMSNSWMASCT